MKSLVIFTTLVIGLVSTGAAAHHKHHAKWARVVDAEPVYRWVKTRVPERRCWTETVATEVRSPDRAASTVAGGIIGSVIGSAAGHDRHSRHAGAAVGAVIGAAIGNDIGRKRGHRSHIEYREVEQCEVVKRYRRERELVGYDVAYRWKGDIYHTHTRQHPGRRIQVAYKNKKHRYHARGNGHY